VALHYGLRCEQALAGIVGLSTYLPLSETLSAEKSSSAVETPIFLAHGIFDPVLVLALGEASRQVLQENACTVEWRTYQMPHTVVPEELKDLSAWLLAKIWPAEVKL
jgi:phospholipase/carboxylesterase